MELAQQVRLVSTEFHVLGGKFSVILGYSILMLSLVATYFASSRPGMEPGDFANMTLVPYV